MGSEGSARLHGSRHQELGLRSENWGFAVSSPGMYHSSVGLDQATNIGDYRSPKSPKKPVLVRMLRTPCQPVCGPRSTAGRALRSAEPSFETFERSIRDQLARILPWRVRSARDIDAITVNRWPHGYAYTNTTRCGTRIGLWESVPATLHGSALDGSPLRTPMPRPPRIPIRRSIRLFVLWEEIVFGLGRLRRDKL